MALVFGSQSCCPVGCVGKSGLQGMGEGWVGEGMQWMVLSPSQVDPECRAEWDSDTRGQCLNTSPPSSLCSEEKNPPGSRERSVWWNEPTHRSQDGAVEGKSGW